MQTSSRSSHIQLAVEAAVAGGLAATAAALVPGADPWLPGVELHPAWIAVALLSAFYGLRGLLMAAPAAWALVGLAAAVLGAPSGLGDRGGAGDALALTACLMIAGVGSLHRRKRAELQQQLAAAERYAEDDARALEELERVALAFRARSQRIDRSIAFWRDIAERLEGTSTTEAAQAALELCMARTGARAGIVRRLDGDALHNVAWRGRWTETNPMPSDIFSDRAMSAAVQRGCVVLAEDVPEAGPDDADVAAPVIAADGRIVGVVGLRGLSRHLLHDADLSDLAQAAQWLAGALLPDTVHPLTSAQAHDGAAALSGPPVSGRERAATWE